MPVISSRISGWRMTDSITLPKMMPMPTPAPTAPRPPPTPRAIALPASEPASACAMSEMRRGSTSIGGSPFVLVALGDCAAEVDRAEGGEDERLQGRHQAQLEEEEDHAGREREDAQDLETQQHREPAGHEQDDQVAGEDVGEKSNGEREQPHEVRDQLEHEQGRGARAVHALGDQALHVADEALGADPLDVEGDEDDEREHER